MCGAVYACVYVSVCAIVITIIIARARARDLYTYTYTYMYALYIIVCVVRARACIFTCASIYRRSGYAGSLSSINVRWRKRCSNGSSSPPELLVFLAAVYAVCAKRNATTTTVHVAFSISRVYESRCRARERSPPYAHAR